MTGVSLGAGQRELSPALPEPERRESTLSHAALRFQEFESGCNTAAVTGLELE